MKPEDIQYKRDLIFGLLEQLGDLHEQIHYQESVPIAQVPAELVCQWFDDFYHPDATEFQECFTTHELELLQRFHLFFEARLDFVPETSDVHELHKSAVWLEIVDKAKETHKTLAQPNA